ncbi:MAG: beta-ketoacyl-[acyl-carrier-protein] synthase family protein [Acidobacteria bacterium]|nr:beta-ketoacyl-[acyl-carrier-protein] synthase family protein [Acidobacteriota bacterium]
MKQTKKIVVTGIGTVSSIGRDAAEFAENLKLGTSGQKDITRYDFSDPVYRTRKGAMVGYDPTELEAMEITQIAAIAQMAAEEAVRDARMDFAREDPFRVGVSLGTSHGGNFALIKYMRQKLAGQGIDYELLLHSTPTIAGTISKRFGTRGPNQTISTACSSGTTSIGYGLDMIRHGRCDVMLAGGADIFSEVSFTGFNSLQAMTKSVCRPFTKERDGIMLGDAAAILVLEEEEHARARGVRTYGYVGGYGLVNEAYHATAPDPTGDGAYRAMQQCLEDANLTPADVDYINAHGTGTDSNDPMELLAIQRLFGDRMTRLYISSTKSMIGHTLGAAGSIELAATLIAMDQGFIPPTINFTSPIDGFEQVNFVPNRAVEAPFETALSNSFAFAGNMASVVVTKKRS